MEATANEPPEPPYSVLVDQHEDDVARVRVGDRSGEDPAHRAEVHANESGDPGAVVRRVQRGVAENGAGGMIRAGLDARDVNAVHVEMPRVLCKRLLAEEAHDRVFGVGRKLAGRDLGAGVAVTQDDNVDTVRGGAIAANGGHGLGGGARRDGEQTCEEHAGVHGTSRRHRTAPEVPSGSSTNSTPFHRGL